MAKESSSPFGWGPLAAVIAILLGLGGAFVLGSVDRSPEPDVNAGANAIVVNGVGSVTAVPDQLGFNATVTHSADSVTAAMDRTSSGVRQVQKALLGKGVSRKDIRTTYVSVEPTYSYKDNEEKIVGYRSSQTISVLVKRFARAGAVMSAAAAADDNAVSIGGVSMSLSKRDALLSQARVKAIRTARAKAGEFAKAGHRDVGEMMLVAETSASPATYRDSAFGNLRAAYGAAAAKAMPISAGEQKVSVNVRVRWQLK